MLEIFVILSSKYLLCYKNQISICVSVAMDSIRYIRISCVFSPRATFDNKRAENGRFYCFIVLCIAAI
jgi:hypothetical protein